MRFLCVQSALTCENSSPDCVFCLVHSSAELVFRYYQYVAFLSIDIGRTNIDKSY